MTPSAIHVKQTRFAQLAARLILHIFESGYECTLGEAYRAPEQAALNAQKGIGIKNTEHTKRLAIDLQLFKDGEYLTDSAAYKPFGDWWKLQGVDCCWGGDFAAPHQDGNHFSIQDGGVK